MITIIALALVIFMAMFLFFCAGEVRAEEDRHVAEAAFQSYLKTLHQTGSYVARRRAWLQYLGSIPGPHCPIKRIKIFSRSWSFDWEKTANRRLRRKFNITLSADEAPINYRATIIEDWEDVATHKTPEGDYPGQLVLTNEMADHIQAIGTDKAHILTHLTCNYAVWNGQSWEHGRFLLFHGFLNEQMHRQDWQLALMEEADMIMCCNWKKALPEKYHHKHISMKLGGYCNQEFIYDVEAIDANKNHEISVGWKLTEDFTVIDWAQIDHGYAVFGSRDYDSDEYTLCFNEGEMELPESWSIKDASTGIKYVQFPRTELTFLDFDYAEKTGGEMTGDIWKTSYHFLDGQRLAERIRTYLPDTAWRIYQSPRGMWAFCLDQTFENYETVLKRIPGVDYLHQCLEDNIGCYNLRITPKLESDVVPYSVYQVGTPKQEFLDRLEVLEQLWAEYHKDYDFSQIRQLNQMDRFGLEYNGLDPDSVEGNFYQVTYRNFEEACKNHEWYKALHNDMKFRFDSLKNNSIIGYEEVDQALLLTTRWWIFNEVIGGPSLKPYAELAHKYHTIRTIPPTRMVGTNDFDEYRVAKRIEKLLRQTAGQRHPMFGEQDPFSWFLHEDLIEDVVDGYALAYQKLKHLFSARTKQNYRVLVERAIRTLCVEYNDVFGYRNNGAIHADLAMELYEAKVALLEEEYVLELMGRPTPKLSFSEGGEAMEHDLHPMYVRTFKNGGGKNQKTWTVYNYTRQDGFIPTEGQPWKLVVTEPVQELIKADNVGKNTVVVVPAIWDGELVNLAVFHNNRSLLLGLQADDLPEADLVLCCNPQTLNEELQHKHILNDMPGAMRDAYMVGLENHGKPFAQTKNYLTRVQMIEDGSFHIWGEESFPSGYQTEMVFPAFSGDETEGEEMDKIRHDVIHAARSMVKRRKDGTTSVTYRGSKFMKLWNEVMGTSDVRPQIPGVGNAPTENLQGVPMAMLAYEGTSGVDAGFIPEYKAEEGVFYYTHYNRAGYLWRGNAQFGIYHEKAGNTYRPSPENEHARQASLDRIQYPREITSGDKSNVFFVNLSDPRTARALVREGLIQCPRTLNISNDELIKYVELELHGFYHEGLDVEIDGTIWVSSQGPHFVPRTKHFKDSTFQYRGSQVFPAHVAHKLAEVNDRYSGLALDVWESLTGALEGDFIEDDIVSVESLIAKMPASNTIQKWRNILAEREITDINGYMTQHGYKKRVGKNDISVIGLKSIVQVVVADILMVEASAIYDKYWQESKHYGAYLKGLIAYQGWLSPGTVLVDINAVKDASKHYIKDMLKDNPVIRVPEGQRYIFGMMQDYSRGGIRVASQANTYIRAEYNDEFVMADHIDRFIDFLFDDLLANIRKGIEITKIFDNIKNAVNFTNAGESDMEVQFLDDLQEFSRGPLEMFWNHKQGRRLIRDQFKRIMNRYRFGFMTKGMHKIGTFGSVKSYITDFNLLPPSLPNGKEVSDSVYVDFPGEHHDKKLPITVVMYKNHKFWDAIGKDEILGGILRYPVSNADMFSGCWVLSPKAFIKHKALFGLDHLGDDVIEWLLDGKSEGIYAHSSTIKELLCGDSDGDTAGIVPFLMDYYIDNRTITVQNMKDSDAVMFWAIHETRDLIKRPFAELEGFMHLKGNRQINPSAVEAILNSTNQAVGSNALYQQAVKALLDTYDAGLFVAIEDEADRPEMANTFNKPSRIGSGKEESFANTLMYELMYSSEWSVTQRKLLWDWYVEYNLIPVYKMIPCSLELSISCQKKDLIEAYHTVTQYCLSDQYELTYGENNDRHIVLRDRSKIEAIEAQLGDDFNRVLDNLKGVLAHEQVGEATWASKNGSLTQLMMWSLSIKVRQPDDSLKTPQWVTRTRTSAMAEKESPETLLADQRDEAWGILQPDGFHWTNSYWAEYIGGHFADIRDELESMIYNQKTYSEDEELRLTWNREYDRGKFIALGDHDGQGVAYGSGGDKLEKFHQNITRWYEIKAKSRLFGMNIHGFNKYNKSTNTDNPIVPPQIHLKDDAEKMGIVFVWRFIQEMYGRDTWQHADHYNTLVEGQGFPNFVRETLEFYADIEATREEYLYTKKIFNYVCKYLRKELVDGDQTKHINFINHLFNEYKEEINSLGEQYVYPADIDTEEKAALLVIMFLKQKVKADELDYIMFEAHEFLGCPNVTQAVNFAYSVITALFSDKDGEMYHFVTLGQDETPYMNSDSFQALVAWWRGIQRMMESSLAKKFRDAHKDELNDITNGWGDEELQNLYHLAHQQCSFYHAFITRNFKNLRRGLKFAGNTRRIITDYMYYIVGKTFVPTTIVKFSSEDNLIFPVVSGHLQNNRILFTKSMFEFMMVPAKGYMDVINERHRVSVRPYYKIVDDREIHAVEIGYINQDSEYNVAGWIVDDPTARVLFYFHDEELNLHSAAHNLKTYYGESNKMPERYSTADLDRVRKTNSPYLASTPHDLNDQLTLHKRFVDAEPRALKAEASIIRFYAEADSVEAQLQRFVDVCVGNVARMANKRSDFESYIVRAQLETGQGRHTYLDAAGKLVGQDNAAEFLAEFMSHILDREVPACIYEKKTGELRKEFKAQKGLVITPNVNFEFEYGDYLFCVVDGVLEFKENTDILDEINPDDFQVLEDMPPMDLPPIDESQAGYYDNEADHIFDDEAPVFDEPEDDYVPPPVVEVVEEEIPEDIPGEPEVEAVKEAALKEVSDMSDFAAAMLQKSEDALSKLDMLIEEQEQKLLKLKKLREETKKTVDADLELLLQANEAKKSLK